MLVLGAEHDGFFTVGEIRRTARAHRTEAEVFPGIGHDMMLDHGWQEVADRIDAWSRALPELASSSAHTSASLSSASPARTRSSPSST